MGRDQEIDNLILKRNLAMIAGNFDVAEEFKAQIVAHGCIVDDIPDGGILVYGGGTAQLLRRTLESHNTLKNELASVRRIINGIERSLDEEREIIYGMYSNLATGD